MTGLVPVLIPVVGSSLVGGLAYLAGWRKQRGKINTTEATDLWKESQSMRVDLTSLVDALRIEVARLTTDYTNMQRLHAECTKHNVELESRLLHLEALGSATELIAAAKVEADRIRAEAKVAAEQVLATAVVVKDALP